MMKMKSSMIAVALLTGFVALSGCASKDPSAAAPAEAAPAMDIPSSSPMSKVTKGMTETDVRKILGEPTSSRDYMTGKQFIPWYFGSDTSRSAWTYAGQGQVVFSRNRYSGGLKVIDVVYDPSTK